MADSEKERSPSPVWVKGFKDDFQRILVDEWSPYLGALLLVLVVVVLMGKGLFWGVFGGVKLWGDYFNNLIGLGPLLGIKPELQSPLIHRISLMDITLLLGAFSAALLSSQFRINRAPRLEYVSGAVGGTLMGLGATLAGGCTTGGFFTPLLFASPAGWMMWIGLLLGAWIGLKLLLWTMENITWGTQPPSSKSDSSLKPYYPVAGLVVLVLVIWWAVRWSGAENARLVSRSVLVLGGFAIGFILHRSRFCLSRVFREPFMTAEGTMTKAMILALAVGIPVASVLLQRQTVDPYLVVPATFWFGSLLGGAIFGLGMIFAGGCASGSLWRIGEGHLKLVVAIFFFGWSGSLFGALVGKLELNAVRFDIDFLDGVPEITPLGFQAYLPELFSGWGWSYILMFGLLALWYGLVRYNESTEQFTVL